MKHPLIRLAAMVMAGAVTAVMVGCASPAPNYTPSIDNVEALKKSGATTVKVGAIAVNADMQGAKAITLRASSMVPPSGTHYGDYLSAALRQELELAKLHNPQSGIEVSGALLRNNIDAGGISTNEGQMEARFVVKKGDQVRFDKVKRIEHQWPSSFVGAIAIPAAQNSYPVMVQKLLSALVSDPEFVQSLRN